MILTVTLNPAVDKIYTTGELIAGHANKMRSAVSSAGGKGVNVTKVLRRYDYPVCATGFLGGYAGKFIEESLQEEGAMCRFIHVEEETRSNIRVLADNGYMTDILEPGPDISEMQLQQFLETYEASLSESELVVLSGSPARGLADDIYVKLIEMARIRGIRTLLDTSGESLRKGITAKPYFIKPNQKELEYIVGHKLVKREDIIEAAIAIHQSGIAHVIVSMGKNGLLSVSSGGYVYFAKPGKVQVLNTVGCGDSVVASFAMSVLQRHSKEEALKRAAAISAANATTMKNAEIPLDTVEELYEQITVEKLR